MPVIQWEIQCVTDVTICYIMEDKTLQVNILIFIYILPFCIRE